MMKRAKLSPEATAALEARRTAAKAKQTELREGALARSAKDAADHSHVYVVSVFSETGESWYDRVVVGAFATLEAAQAAVLDSTLTILENVMSGCEMKLFIDRVGFGAFSSSVEVCRNAAAEQASIDEWTYTTGRSVDMSADQDGDEEGGNEKARDDADEEQATKDAFA